MARQPAAMAGFADLNGGKEAGGGGGDGSPGRLKSTLSSEPLHSSNDKQQRLSVAERLTHSHSQPSLPNSAQSVVGEFENAQAV